MKRKIIDLYLRGHTIEDNGDNDFLLYFLTFLSPKKRETKLDYNKKVVNINSLQAIETVFFVFGQFVRCHQNVSFLLFGLLKV